jgi:hypothetical protein
MIDPNAFVSQSAVIGVYGEGFDEMKVKVKQQINKDNQDNKNNNDSIRNQQPA